MVIALPVMLPLAYAALTLALRARPAAQRAAAIFGAFMHLIACGALAVKVAADGIVAAQFGNWPAPFGITFVADHLSSLMVLISALINAACVAYAGKDIDAARVRAGFYPLFALLIMGVSGAFLTGDLFNLYVWFEVLLMASFMLLVLGGERRQTSAAIKYVALNLVSSAFFLSAVAVLYRMTGTLNMADLARLAPAPLEGAWLAVAILLLFVFGIKAAIFPLHFWLPASYHTPPPVISAAFSGLLTKVGVYALLRTFTLLFPLQASPLQPYLLALAGLTMFTGVMGAIAQDNLRRLLSFHIISQIGYMLGGLALFSTAALAGAVFFVVHNILAKSNLFLVSGLVLRTHGTEELHELGGMVETHPRVTAAFLLSAMSLAGLPPLAGFVAKVALLRAGMESERYLLVAVMLAVSLLTLFSMMKIFTRVFWGRRPANAGPVARVALTQQMPIAVIAILIIVTGLFGEGVYRWCEQAAEEMLHPQQYIDAVLSGPRLGVRDE